MTIQPEPEIRAFGEAEQAMSSDADRQALHQTLKARKAVKLVSTCILIKLLSVS